MAGYLKRILYVEDDRDVQTIVRLALETVGGFTVQVCSSGREALDIVAAFAPDLVVLDVMMPVMDGPATLKALHEIPQISRIPVVFMTAKSQPSEVARYKGLGAVDVIIKPFDPLTLSRELRDIWARSQAQ